MSKPLNIACLATGGYGGKLINSLVKCVAPDRAWLVAVCSMEPPTPLVARHLRSTGATIYDSIDGVLDHPGLDAVMIPTSIDSHLPFTVAALERGLHVHCEKPITATVQDAYKMIEARNRAGRLVTVGYQDHYASITTWAKQKILDGAIGRVKQVTVSACWPRSDSYYGRNNWAGAVKRQGAWVLDSPANNALSHEINIPLFVTGPSMSESNRATRLEAELYRARDIENFDTCAMRCATEQGPEILILLTHAAAHGHGPVTEFIGEAGMLRRTNRAKFELIRDGEVVETCEQDEPGPHGHMLNHFVDAVAGESDVLLCRIENAIAPLVVVNAASQCAPVHDIDAAHSRRLPLKPDDDPNDMVCAIEGIEAVFAQCVERFSLPSETGQAPWAHPPGRIDLADYRAFAGLAQA
jgi:predicted dehydrogenase